ncbi:MAG: lantibiotic immunity ABC transporter MutE/EpiE family permease subunit [Candidatus Cellulosilyticum pullistercoris]|uniref:Lantibiotic immunity ABC transporter MutE/EpiE family permease subunit n=1 Tax=Candidatus Cellulosilyticum pullistercoris TaxID=2838521 RepID=A0A9E2NK40_9FIRM|nr:lantibiotic immunity ABC transporter MutE/EpiE family permease subunit [Candidatus Cellulosilyticum pullistercoris]
MLNYVKAEILKQKGSFNHKIIWLVPTVIIALAIVLMGSSYTFSGAYNWWYILFLPFTFTYIAATFVTKDQKKNYHGLMAIAKDKKRIWYAKVIVATLYLLVVNMIFFMMMIIGSKVLGLYIMPTRKGFTGSLLLFMTFAWQMPLFMYVGQKVGVFLSILISVVCNMIIACICALESYWWIPFAIPARLMCPAIGVLPNGLLVEEAGKRFASRDVILPGVIITVILYVLISWLTAQGFSRKEV